MKAYLPILALVLAVCGCQNPYGRTIASTSTAVTGALSGWDAYAQARFDAGEPVPVETERKVLQAAIKYDLSETLARSAYAAYEQDKGSTNIVQTLELALRNLVSNQTNITSLIQAFEGTP